MSQSGAPPAPFKYRAFISYSHSDTAWADWLHKAVERYRVPRPLVGRRTAQGLVPARLVPPPAARLGCPSRPRARRSRWRGSPASRFQGGSESCAHRCGPTR